jgi:hypothetical protein
MFDLQLATLPRLSRLNVWRATPIERFDQLASILNPLLFAAKNNQVCAFIGSHGVIAFCFKNTPEKLSDQFGFCELDFYGQHFRYGLLRRCGIL